MRIRILSNANLDFESLIKQYVKTSKLISKETTPLPINLKVIQIWFLTESSISQLANPKFMITQSIPLQPPL
jgi:hypothetical protein